MPDPTLRDNYIELFRHRVSDLSNRLASGDIDLRTWQIDMRETIRESYAAQIWSATDGTPGMNDYLKIGNAIQQQDRYLEDFAHAIADGDVSPDAIASRAEMYAESSKQMYWNQATGDAKLPAYPGDGSTPCHGHCGCEWRDNGDGSYSWVRAKDDSCEPCVQREIDWANYVPDGVPEAA